MRTWVVIYQTNLGYVYGWLCRGGSISSVEEDFWMAIGDRGGTTVKCIAYLESNILETLLPLYERKEA